MSKHELMAQDGREGQNPSRGDIHVVPLYLFAQPFLCFLQVALTAIAWGMIRDAAGTAGAARAQDILVLMPFLLFGVPLSLIAVVFYALGIRHARCTSRALPIWFHAVSCLSILLPVAVQIGGFIYLVEISPPA